MSFIYLSESTTENKDICKVGKTTRDPEKRAKEYAGGWKVYKSWRVPEISLSIYETRAHKSLKSWQVPSKETGLREVFSINAKEALPIVDKSIKETNKELIEQEASNEIYQAEINRQQEKKKQERIRIEQQQLEKQRQIKKNKEEAELQAIKVSKAARKNKDELIDFFIGLILLIAAIAFLNWFFEVAF